MRPSQLLYSRIAFLAIILSFCCYVLKNIRFPGDTVIARYPDTTLHDIIYFSAENFVNFCGLVAFTNLCYLCQSCFPESTIVLWTRRLSVCMCVITFVRCIGHVFTYFEVTRYELIADIVLIVLLFITRPLYRHAT